MPLDEPTMSANLKLALKFKSVVADKTEKEVDLGRIVGSFGKPP